MRRRQRRWGRLTFSQAGEGGESGADGHGRELLFRRHFFLRQRIRSWSARNFRRAASLGLGGRRVIFLWRTLNYAIFRFLLPPALHPFAQWVKEESRAETWDGLTRSFDTTCLFHKFVEILRSSMGGARIWFVSQD